MNPAPSNALRDGATPAEIMSSLADGELRGREVEEGCRRWREDTAARALWHTYHLIGDVLRSEDLANTVRHDADFVRSLRERLRGEPAVLAPAPMVKPNVARRWWLSAAAFAGVAVVAGIVAGSGPRSDEGSRFAASAGLPMQRVGAAAVPASAQRLDIDGKLIRDARLDAYFEAHRGAVGGMPSALPGGGALRSVDTIVPQR